MIDCSMLWRRWFVFGAGLALATSTLAQERGIAGVAEPTIQRERSRRWAILIGIDQYTNPQAFPTLKCCVADVKLLHKTLCGPWGGFDPENVVLMVDDSPAHLKPTRSNIIGMLASWLSRPKRNDTVVVSFSGHGIDVDHGSYILPSDANLGALALTGIEVKYVHKCLQGCKAGRKVLVLDCCHSGGGRGAAKMIKKPQARGLAVLTAIKQAMHHFNSDPRQSAIWLAGDTGKPAPQMQRACFRVNGNFGWQRFVSLSMSPELPSLRAALEADNRFLVTQGYLDEPADLDQVIDGSLMDQVDIDAAPLASVGTAIAPRQDR